MRKAILFVLVGALLSGCDKSDSNSSTTKGVSHLEVFNYAKKVKDDYTAMVAMSYIYLNDTTNMEHADSLSRLYLNNGLVEPGLTLAQKVYDADKDNIKSLELIAEAQGILGKFTESVKNFNKLYELKHDVRYLYYLAKIESNRGDMQQFNNRLDQILQDTGTAQVEMPTANGGVQKVDMKAAVNFFKAQMLVNNGQLNEANAFLKKALAISPNFESALVGIEQIKEIRAGGTGSVAPQQMSRQQRDEIERKRKQEAEEYERFKRQNGMK